LCTGIVIIAVNRSIRTTAGRIALILGACIIIVTMNFFGFTTNCRIARISETIRSGMTVYRGISTSFSRFTAINSTKIVIIAGNGFILTTISTIARIFCTLIVVITVNIFMLTTRRTVAPISGTSIIVLTTDGFIFTSNIGITGFSGTGIFIITPTVTIVIVLASL